MDLFKNKYKTHTSGSVFIFATTICKTHELTYSHHTVGIINLTPTLKVANHWNQKWFM